MATPLMTMLFVLELVSGISALLLTAVGFTNLSAGEGLPDQRMQKKHLKTAKRMFWVAGALWAVCAVSYLCLH